MCSKILCKLILLDFMNKEKYSKTCSTKTAKYILEE